MIDRYTKFLQRTKPILHYVRTDSFQALNSTTLALENFGIAKVLQMTLECKYDSLVMVLLL